MFSVFPVRIIILDVMQSANPSSRGRVRAAMSAHIAHLARLSQGGLCRALLAKEGPENPTEANTRRRAGGFAQMKM
jgi:hypothetical protein